MHSGISKIQRVIACLVASLLLAGIPATLTAQETKAEPQKSPEQTVPLAPAAAKDAVPATAATAIKAVRVDNGRVVLTADGKIGQFNFFTLKTPPRLVVDVSGVRPDFKDRRFSISGGFSQLRVGSDKGLTRLVFDAAGESLPAHGVEATGNELIVTWTGSAAPSPALTTGKKAGSPAVSMEKKPVSAKAPPAGKKARPVVEAVDFGLDNGQSVLTVSLNGPPEVTEPVAEGSSVRFGIRDAEISRALRRTIDASAFPSAVRQVIPYVATEKGKQEVRFNIELKGMVPYSLQKDGNRVRFLVENKNFAEPAPAAEKLEIPVATPAEAPIAMPAAPPPSIQPALAPPAMADFSPTAEPKVEVVAVGKSGPSYRGEKISLVFDDANIRNILQLIGEISHLNIIAGEEVKGTITLRLIDVPWDQALDLILETKGLGMLQDGNVVRIMPQEQIRARRQAELTAVKEERQLEPLVTEVIAISYTDLGNISGPAREVLSERGKITQDARNKQIIVTDVPSIIAEIRRLASILDTPERQVMIEARIVEANSSFTRDLGVKWGISYEENPGAGADKTSINAGLGGSFLISPPTAGNVLGGAGLGTGITFGRIGIDSTVLDLRISALETSGHGKVISTPRVSTLNGGEAKISQGTKIPYQSSGSDGLPKTEFVDANLELKVKPVINPDNSIILDIQANNSSIGSTVSTGAGAAPAIDTKEAQTKVLVRDGETTVIGGIFVEQETYSEAGVPLLMKVPILGHLFKSTNSNTTRAELLVFITPRIVSTR